MYTSKQVFDNIVNGVFSFSDFENYLSVLNNENYENGKRDGAISSLLLDDFKQSLSDESSDDYTVSTSTWTITAACDNANKDT
jgi:hypothetical protein